MRDAGHSGISWANTVLSAIFLILSLSLIFFIPALSGKETGAGWTGRRIMDEVFKGHELFPYVYEEQTMILTDSAGNQDVRKVRRFSRVEKDGTIKYLLVFDSPAEVRGVALRVIRQYNGPVESWIYLPAFGKELTSSDCKSRDSHFLGTDFAMEDLTEILSDFRYVRIPDQTIEKVAYFVVEAFPQDEKIEQSTGYSIRRHFIRQDNFFIVRTDYFDRRGRFSKRLTQHDLKNINGNIWTANMILMENRKQKHKTLIKIDRRVFSRDYVPPKMFTSSWLQDNRHIRASRLFREALESSLENQGDGTNNNIGN